MAGEQPEKYQDEVQPPQKQKRTVIAPDQTLGLPLPGAVKMFDEKFVGSEPPKVAGLLNEGETKQDYLKLPQEEKDNRHIRLYLQIANELKKRQTEGTPIDHFEISRLLHAKGPWIRQTLDWMEVGIIAFQPDGQAYFRFPYEGLRKKMQEASAGLTAKQLAKATVVEAVMSATADQATLTVQQQLKLGAGLFPALVQWAFRRGIGIEQLLQMELHKVVIEALNESDKVPGLEEEVQDLKRSLEYFKGQSDPYVRIRKAYQDALKVLDICLAIKILGGNPKLLLDKFADDISRYVGVV